MPEVERYELPIDVRPEDIDELGHVNNVVYLRWIQNAAVAHWQDRATEEDQSALFWVVTRPRPSARRRPPDGRASGVGRRPRDGYFRVCPSHLIGAP